jgi:HNH endonuclease
METDHIVPKADGGSDAIENAIPVCFECHAEIHLYNPDHPRGRRYLPDELRAHREQWLELCRTSARFLASVPPQVDVGPLQGLVDELEFNMLVIARPSAQSGAPLEDARFNDCLARGAISLMDDGLKALIYTAYASIKRANAYLRSVPSFPPGQDSWAQAFNRANRHLAEARPEVEAALSALRNYLKQDA